MGTKTEVNFVVPPRYGARQTWNRCQDGSSGRGRPPSWQQGKSPERP